MLVELPPDRTGQKLYFGQEIIDAFLGVAQNNMLPVKLKQTGEERLNAETAILEQEQSLEISMPLASKRRVRDHWWNLKRRVETIISYEKKGMIIGPLFPNQLYMGITIILLDTIHDKLTPVKNSANFSHQSIAMQVILHTTNLLRQRVSVPYNLLPRANRPFLISLN